MSAPSVGLGSENHLAAQGKQKHSSLSVTEAHPEAKEGERKPMFKTPPSSQWVEAHADDNEPEVVGWEKKPPSANTVEGQLTYSVVGNHPILARPDKYGLTFNDAVAYSEELVKAGYEGVTIREQGATVPSGNDEQPAPPVTPNPSASSS